MAARKANTTNSTQSTQALKQELEQLERRLAKAKEDQQKDTETMLDKLRHGWEAARKKEGSARDKLAETRNKKKTPAQQRQLEAARQRLVDAKAQTQTLSAEMAEAQESLKGFKTDSKRAAERAKMIAKQATEYDKKRRRPPSTTSSKVKK